MTNDVDDFNKIILQLFDIEKGEISLKKIIINDIESE